MTPLPLLALALVFTYPSAFGLMPSVLMFVFFLFVVHGNSLFGGIACVGDRVAAVLAAVGADATVGFHGHENLSLSVANFRSEESSISPLKNLTVG